MTCNFEPEELGYQRTHTLTYKNFLIGASRLFREERDLRLQVWNIFEPFLNLAKKCNRSSHNKFIFRMEKSTVCISIAKSLTKSVG
jgi:hypothetical protein